jgi:hypothetical protein
MVATLEAKWGTILRPGEYVCQVGKWVGLFDERGEKHLLSYMHLLRFAHNTLGRLGT